MDNERRATLLALSAVLLWSTVATAFKLGLAVLTPVQLLLIGAVISTICFWIVAWISGQCRLPLDQWGRASAMGLLNPVGYYLVLFAAYDRLPAQIAQPLNYTWVLTLALLSVPLLGQPLHKRTIVGLLISYVGVLFVLTRGSWTILTSWDATGIALVLFSTLIWSLYWILSTRTRSHALALMVWSFSFSIPVLILLTVLQGDWPTLTASTLLIGAWVGLVEMGVTFLLWQRALQLTSRAARLGQLVFLSPFLSLIFIATILGETISAWSVVGLVIIVTGILWSSRSAPTPTAVGLDSGSP
jgi:drug/metabolite transporter (DMT)-like permease